MSAHKPRVVIDARMAGAVGHGIANYVLELAEGLAALPLDFEPCYLIHTSCPRSSLLRELTHAESAIPFLHPQEPLSLASEIAQLEPALYHTPSFASLLRYPCPHVQTVHDLNHLQFGGWKKKAYYRFLLLPSLRRALTVLSVSETAARELEAWMRSHGESRTVAVAYNSIAPLLPPVDDTGLLQHYGLKAGSYFLTLANSKPHKNLALLERAYRTAKASDPNLPPLVLSVAGTSDPGVLHTGPLGEKEKGALLRHARAFFFPSLYEGFGRPPLEAALAGVVPVVSGIAVHREVLSGVPETIFLDPQNESAWAAAFLREGQERGSVSPTSRTWIERTYSVSRLAGVMEKTFLQALETSSASG